MTTSISDSDYAIDAQGISNFSIISADRKTEVIFEVDIECIRHLIFENKE
tara:strand:+ start:1034 stop:1183 length:150 start_codon:yes stop_codon:yes gene_type:complete